MQCKFSAPGVLNLNCSILPAQVLLPYSKEKNGPEASAACTCFMEKDAVEEHEPKEEGLAAHVGKLPAA